MKAERQSRVPATGRPTTLRVPISRPMCTCPHCRRSFRAESRTKALCPHCGYRLIGGM
jgi:Zn finger protein HypA/HybF involved in hydrogenase expression